MPRAAPATNRLPDRSAASGSTRRSGRRPRARVLDRAWRAGRRSRFCSVIKRATTWMLSTPLNAIAVGQFGSRPGRCAASTVSSAAARRLFGPRRRRDRFDLRAATGAGGELAIEIVANQESHVPEKQRRAGCRPRSAIRLAHLPGEAAVPPGGARLLSAWRTRSLTSQKSSSAPAAVRVARFGLRISRARQPPRQVGRDS